MWDKLTRKVIFLYIYNILFWDNLDLVAEKVEIATDNNIPGLVESDPNELINIDDLKIYSLDSDLKDIPKKFIEDNLGLFKQNQARFETILKPLLSNWGQTYLIVKAILFTFLLELDYLKNPQNKTTKDDEVSCTDTDDNSQLIGKYLRLSQEYGNSQSVAVIHAVLAKIFDSKNS
jgi:transcription termination factor NusB